MVLGILIAFQDLELFEIGRLSHFPHFVYLVANLGGYCLLLLDFCTKSGNMGRETSNVRTDFLDGRLKSSYAWKKLVKHVRHLFGHHLSHVLSDLGHGGCGGCGGDRFGDDSDCSSWWGT